MIRESEIISIGAFAKPHGIKGELNAELDYDVDIREFKCLIIDIDGIYVPFFIDGYRTRGKHSVLIHLDGVNDEKEAKSFAGKEIYALRSEVDTVISEDESDGLYASDLLGFMLCSEEGEDIGVIDGYDDSTDNVLFIVKRNDDAPRPLYVPVVDEFITNIDLERKRISMSLPDGILEL